MKRPRSLVLGTACAIAVTLSLVSFSGSQSHRSGMPVAAAAGGCGLEQAALCETFDAPAGTGTRAGALNGTLWGVSRTSQNTNPGQGLLDSWAPVTLGACGQPTVTPAADVQICGGRLVEGVNDDGGVTVLAAYPKQPFDWAGRTGIVTFDVDLNASGPHGAWPAFAITDLPVPAPYGSASSQASRAQSQLGFSLAATCGAGSACGNGCAGGDTQVSVDSMYLVRRYQYEEVAFTPRGCVAAQPGTLNHVEVQLSQSQISVWATAPGGGPLVELADSGPVAVPFSRGLIWLEDVHYNAAKFGPTSSYTFQWDNVGFDGPRLPRDLAYDVADALTPAGGGRVNLGYAVSNQAPTTLAVAGLADPGTAQKALLTLNLFPFEARSFQYQLNGGAWHDSGWPFGPDTTYQWNTLALPVPLSELHAGQNAIALRLTAADTWVVANLDLILVGAGGTGGGGGRSTPTATASPSATASPTASPSPTPSPSPSPTASPSPIPSPTVAPAPSFTATGSDTANPVMAGSGEALTATVKSATAATALVDMEVYDPTGQRVYQRYWDNQTFSAGQKRNYTNTWTVPAGQMTGMYTLKVGVYAPGWGQTYVWNGNAAQFAVATPATPSFSVSATDAFATLKVGARQTVTASVTSATACTALVDVELYSPSGQKVFQKLWDTQSFAAGQSSAFSLTWAVPAGAPTGSYTVKVGVFSAGWGQLYTWDDTAATFTVTH
ncbi:MAG TPA: hypothetical protein VFD32_06580 [Dehalococcoidia bacterium]|nr:hypothetical protein [Dehalococcoidia bacterium]